METQKEVPQRASLNQDKTWHPGNYGLNSVENKITEIIQDLPFQISFQEIRIQMTKLESKLLQIRIILIPIKKIQLFK